MKFSALYTAHSRYLLIIGLILLVTYADAQTRNPRPTSYNPYGTYTNGKKEYLRMSTGYRNEILREATLYDGAGQPINVAKPGLLGDFDHKTRGGYNAAAMIRIRVDGQLQNAVLCWNVYTTKGGRDTGFILTKNLRYRSTIEERMTLCRKKLKEVRPDDYEKAVAPYEIIDKAVPAKFEDDYVYANQTGAENKLAYFYVIEGTLNLLVDLPYTQKVQGEIKGKAIDLGSVGRRFYRVKVQPSAKRDIYQKGSDRVIGQVAFVYGYVISNDGTRVYCWANRDCLRAEETSFPDLNKWYRLSSEQRPDRGLHDADQDYITNNGQPVGNFVVTHPYRGYTAQRWRFAPTGDGYYRIYSQRRPHHSLHNVDRDYVRNNGVGNYVVTYPTHENWSSQKWRIVSVGNGYYRLYSKKYLDRGLYDAESDYVNDNNSYAGSYVINHPYRPDHASQKWRFETIGEVSARQSTTAEKSYEEEPEGSLPRSVRSYPNPVRDVLHVVLPPGGPFADVQLEVYTLQGQRVLRQRITTLAAEVDVRMLRAGTYLLRWVGSDSVVPSVLVKE